jgi:alpha-tubulin suppressor-like RCC1 family protein
MTSTGFERAVIGLAIAASTLCGCGADNGRIGWEFEFANDALRMRAVLVEGTIIEGGCAGSVSRYVGSATATEMPSPPSALVPGTYGFRGRARDASCTWFAQGCTDVTVPVTDGPDRVLVVLDVAAETAACAAAECAAGACTNADAGSDSATDAMDSATDSNIPDAPPTDVPTDVPIDADCMMDGDPCAGGTCHAGSCCTGCWNGASCQTGDTGTACGVDGEVCSACDCSCTAGACTAPSVTEVTAGSSFTCAAETSGRLYCWGSNLFGQLGQGTSGAGTEVLAPTLVGTLTNWSAIGSGDGHVCAVSGGSLHCWGDNMDGQIGTGGFANLSAPARVGTATDWAAAEGSAGGDHTCVINAGGTLHCMGQNSVGQAGVGTGTDVTTPTPVTGTWDSFSLGHHHTCGIQTDGTLWCWGDNNRGQVGIGSTADANTPRQVGAETTWTAVGLGDEHSCAIRGGALYCWGYNISAQLGDGTTVRRTSPVLIGADTDWVAVDGGLVHTCAVKAAGRVFCVGNDVDGQLGDGTVGGGSMTLMPVVDISDATDVTAGELHNCAHLGDGSIQCWGGNADGALGQGDRVSRPRPATVCVGP